MAAAGFVLCSIRKFGAEASSYMKDPWKRQIQIRKKKRLRMIYGLWGLQAHTLWYLVRNILQIYRLQNGKICFWEQAGLQNKLILSILEYCRLK